MYIAQRTSNAKQHNWFAKLTAFIGVLVCTGALIFQIVELFNLGNWTLIGLLGVSLIVMGSLYERFGLPIASVFISKQ